MATLMCISRGFGTGSAQKSWRSDVIEVFIGVAKGSDRTTAKKVM
jgi:hypothetical protein